MFVVFINKALSYYEGNPEIIVFVLQILYKNLVILIGLIFGNSQQAEILY